MKVAYNQNKILVPGFKFAGIPSGIKNSDEKDLALIYSEVPAVTAGVFTTNRIKAAPVMISQQLLKKHKKCQAIVVNSGNANACTGKFGFKDARDVISLSASKLGINPEYVHVSSTGVIGVRLPVAAIKKSLTTLVKELSPEAIPDVSSAIMTTDSFPKISSRKIKIGKQTATIAGIAKGAGMICPNMATMLCFFVTDISINHEALNATLHKVVSESFNRMSVDNDMSTNDTVMIMANGVSGNAQVNRKSISCNKFEKSLLEIAHDLSRMIVKDGEGATKLIEIIIKGAKTAKDADMVARRVANSMLVKTALYGRDPNWGRIMAAIGYSGARINENSISISIGGVKLVHKGIGTDKEHLLTKVLSEKELSISINLGVGKNTAKFITSDLTEEYIRINAHYRT